MHVVGMEREINAYKIVVVKPERNRAIGRSKHVWENDFLKRALKIYARREWTGEIWFRIGTTLKDISLFPKASRRAVGLIQTFIA
jgi:AAA+ superfamily predicted ATPase